MSQRNGSQVLFLLFYRHLSRERVKTTSSFPRFDCLDVVVSLKVLRIEAGYCQIYP